jgi:D-aspartate ligase
MSRPSEFVVVHKAVQVQQGYRPSLANLMRTPITLSMRRTSKGEAITPNSGRLPVVALAPGSYLAPLAVMRSLHYLGVAVYAPATHDVSLCGLSRYCAGLLQIGENGSPSATNPDATVEQLQDAGRTLGGHAVLMPCSDEWALFVAKYAKQLRGTYRFPRLSHNLAHRLADKHQLQSLATEMAVEIPASVLPVDWADVVRLSGVLDYPVIIKTSTSRDSGNRTAVVSSSDELVAAFELMDDPGNLICQRLVPGTDSDGWLFNGYFDGQSRCIARFSGRKLRQWPAGRGFTILAEATRNPEVEQIAIGFLTGVGYCGPVDMDFRRDPADGSYKLLDVNPRLGGVFRLFEDRQGLDVARAMYLDLIGEPIEQDAQREGRRFVHEGGFLVATLKSWLAAASTPAATIREVRGAEMGTFRWTDPLPFLVHMVTTIRTLGASRLRHYLRSRSRRPRGQKTREETPPA